MPKTKNVRVCVSTIAHIYAFLFILLMVMSAGDEPQTLYLAPSFSWTIVWVIWLCNSTDHVPDKQHRETRAFLRHISTLFLTLQCWAFFTWAIVEWTQTDKPNEGVPLIRLPTVFYGLVIGILFAKSVLVSVAFFIVSWYHEYQ